MDDLSMAREQRGVACHSGETVAGLGSACRAGRAGCCLELRDGAAAAEVGPRGCCKAPGAASSVPGGAGLPAKVPAPTAWAGLCAFRLSTGSRAGERRSAALWSWPRPSRCLAPPLGRHGARSSTSAMELDELLLLDALAYLEGLMALVVFVGLRLVSSPYGRYSPQWSGPRVSARLAWVLQELPSLAWPLYECARPAATRLSSLPNRVLMAMFLIHYVQRTLVFPVLIRGGKPTLLFSLVTAFLFCTFNGYLQSRYLSQFAVYTEDWITHPCFLTGFTLWLMGMVINIHSDYILRNLRKPGETGYKIPRGGLFEYVSAANYFGEIVEWSGFALASWSLQGGVFALFTFCTLFSRAKHHHQWYHEKFEDYPKSRKMLIPFVV